MSMNLEIYDRKAPTKRVAVIPIKLQPRFLEELSGVGGGSFDVRSTDKRIEYLQERNIVKVRIGGKIVTGFIITSVRPKMIDSGEFSAEITTVIGKGLKQWADDAVVHPHGGIRATSGDERSFNFASPRGSWINLNSWSKPRLVSKVRDKKGPWGTGPQDWPDFPTAYWIWAPKPAKGGSDIGTCYFRRDFSVTAKGKFAFFVAADDIYEVYVDGQLVANATPGAENWSRTQRIDFELEKGAHVIGVKVHNATGGGGFVGAIAEVGDAKNQKFAKLLAVTNANTWKVLPFPENNPGWTPGEIMNQLLAEAKDRGVWWAKFVKPTYTATRDSNGQAWTREVDYSFTIGESYLSVMDKMSELSCDIWIDPSNYSLNMAISRGRDYSDPSKSLTMVQLRKGRDLMGADQTVEATIKNALVVDTSTGKMYEKDNSSIAKYGVIEDSLNLSTDLKVSKQIVSKVLAESSKFSTGATYKIHPTSGVIPFQDYTIGDWVQAPGEDGPKTRRRVSSIAVTENAETGDVEYAVEFDTVFQTRQQHMDRWMSSVLAGSMGGTVLSSQFKLPRVLTNRSGGNVFLSPPVINVYAQDITTSGYYTPAGTAVAKASMQWQLSDDQGDAIPTEGYKYEIYGVPDPSEAESTVLLASTGTNSVTVRDLPTEENYTFRVVAKGAGGEEITSDDITVQLPGPEEIPLPRPTPPTLKTNAGAVTVTWDGNYEGEAESYIPGRVSFIRVIASEVPGGPYTDKGPIIPKVGGSATYAGLTQGTEWYIALITVDFDGNESVPSEEAQVTIKGINGELDIEIGTLNKELLDNGILSELGDIESATKDRAILVKNHSFETEGVWEPYDLGDPQLVLRTGRTEVGTEEAYDGKWIVRASTADEEALTSGTVVVSAASGGASISMQEGGTYAAAAKVKFANLTGTSYAILSLEEVLTREPFTVKSITTKLVTMNQVTTDKWETLETDAVKVGAPTTGEYIIRYSLVATKDVTLLEEEPEVSLDSIELFDRTPVLAVNGNTFSQNPAAGNGESDGALWYQYAVVGGTPGDIKAMWRWDGTEWKPIELRNEVIANLDAGKIDTGFLNAARILAGSIGGDKITANSIVASKLAIGGGPNLLWDPNFSSWQDASWANTPSGGPGSGWDTTTRRPGMYVSQKITQKTGAQATQSIYSAMRQQVSVPNNTNTDRLVYVGDRVGDKLVAYSHWYVDKDPSSSVGNGISSQIYFYNAAGSNFVNSNGGRTAFSDIPVGEWFKVGGLPVTVPAGALYAVIRPTVYFTNNTAPTNDAIFYLGGEEMYWQTSAVMIENGAVTADKITASQEMSAKIGQFLEVRAGQLIADSAAMNSAFINQLVSDQAFFDSMLTSRLIVGGGNLIPWSAPNNVPWGNYGSGTVITGRTDTQRGEFVTLQGGNGTNGTLAIAAHLTQGLTGGLVPEAIQVTAGETYTIRAELGVSDYGGSAPAGASIRSGRIRTAQYDATGTYIAGTTRYGNTVTNVPYGRGLWSELQVTMNSAARGLRVWIEKAIWSSGSLTVMTATVEKAVGAILLEDGAVTADKIQADAIDGKTITGATIRTAASGQRMQFDVNGLRAFNSAGDVSASISAAGGSLVLGGSITLADAGGVPGIDPGYISTSGVFLNQPQSRGGSGYFGVHENAYGSSTFLFAGKLPSVLNPMPSGSASIEVVSNGNINLNGRNISFNGDTNWANFTRASGMAGTAQWRRYLGVIYVRMNITTTVAAGDHVQLGTLPAAARPSKPTALNASGTAGPICTSYVDTGGVIRFRNANNHTATAPYVDGSFLQD